MGVDAVPLLIVVVEYPAGISTSTVPTLEPLAVTIVVVTVLWEFQIVVDVTYARLPVGYTISTVPETCSSISIALFPPVESE